MIHQEPGEKLRYCTYIDIFKFLERVTDTVESKIFRP
jgi:hypothetical protein